MYVLYRDCLDTRFFMSQSWLSLDACMSCLCLEFQCLMTAYRLCLCQAQVSAYSVLKHWNFLLKVCHYPFTPSIKVSKVK